MDAGEIRQVEKRPLSLGCFNEHLPGLVPAGFTVACCDRVFEVNCNMGAETTALTAAVQRPLTRGADLSDKGYTLRRLPGKQK